MKLRRIGKRIVAQSEFYEKDALKAAGFRWSPSDRYWWTASVENAAKLLGVAEMSPKLRAEAEGAGQAHIDTVEASRAVDADMDIPRPDGLEYMPFQRAGIAFALGRDNTLIGDEMGLGKTIQAIGIVNASPDARRVLVICPASLKLNWQRELTKWLTRPMSVGIGNGTGIPDTDIVIVNYDILTKHKAALTAGRWDVAVLDEVHYIKNAKAQRTKAAIAIARKAKRIIALTGTPILNRPKELFTVLNLLDPANWPKFFRFAMRYCAAFQDRWGWNFDGASNLSELQDRLRSTIMVRRMKSEVLKDLPAKVRQIIVLPTNGLAAIVKADAAVARKWDAVLTELEAEIEVSEEYDDAVRRLSEARQTAFAEMSRVRHLTALAKVPYVAAHVRDAVEQTGKVVVMAHHHDVIDALRADLDDLGVVSLTGRDSIRSRQESIDAFQNDPDVQVFVGSIQAAGVGITLTASTTMIFSELDWVPGNVSQAEDRIHRIGQTGSVLIQHIVVDGTMDQRMASTLVSKQNVIDKALDDVIILRPTQAISKPIEPQKRARDESNVETVTYSQVLALKVAITILAGNDPDGATLRNDIGFNGFDAPVGHSLADAAQIGWSQRQAQAAKRLVKKYHRQLPHEIYAEIYPEGESK